MGSVVVAEKGHALAVPAAAMRKDEQGDYVLAVENGVLVKSARRAPGRAASSSR